MVEGQSSEERGEITMLLFKACLSQNTLGSQNFLARSSGRMRTHVGLMCLQALTQNLYWKKAVLEYEKCDAAMMELRGEIDSISSKLEGDADLELLQEAVRVMPRWTDALKPHVYKRAVERWTACVHTTVTEMEASSNYPHLCELSAAQREEALAGWSVVCEMLKDAAFLDQPLINSLWSQASAHLHRGKAALLTCKLADAMAPFCEHYDSVGMIEKHHLDALLPLLTEKDVIDESIDEVSTQCWDMAMMMLTLSLSGKEELDSEVTCQDLYTCSSRLRKLLKDGSSDIRGKVLEASSAALQLRSRVDQEVQKWVKESSPRADLVHTLSLKRELPVFR